MSGNPCYIFKPEKRPLPVIPPVCVTLQSSEHLKLSGPQKMSATRLDTRFRNFVETAPDPVLLLDDDGWIVAANAATERLCNAEPGSLTGRHIDDLPALRDPESAKRVFVL